MRGTRGSAGRSGMLWSQASYSSVAPSFRSFVTYVDFHPSGTCIAAAGTD